MNILVTGATGFVGHFLCSQLLASGYRVRATLLPSESHSSLVDGVEPVMIEPVDTGTEWGNALESVETIIHLAARVHIMQETAHNPLQEYRRVNLHGTEKLASQAAERGVRRFIFMSTIGVNGDDSGDSSFTEADNPYPNNPYSVSKLEAELVLREIAQKTGMEIVIIRAPLVYGPGNPGNFFSLLHIISSGTPLPFARVSNKRSLIYVGNLVDALDKCAVHPLAAGKTYLVSDDEEVSTPELILRAAEALGVKARLFPVHPFLLRLAGSVAGRSGALKRLTGSLIVDSTKIRLELGWQPPFTMDQGLRETAQWYTRASRG